MRWDNLFDDLESQLEQGLTAEEIDLQAEEERLRLGRLTMRDRIASIRDSFEKRADYSVRLQLSTGEYLGVRPSTIGKDWLSGDIRDETPRHRQCIVPLAAIAGLVLTSDLVRRSLIESPSVAGESVSARLGFGFVLRDLCRRRVGVEIETPGGAVIGTIDRVGRDHCDVALHDAGSPRRASSVTGYRVVPFREIAIIRL